MSRMRRASLAVAALLPILACSDGPTEPRRPAADPNGGAWATWVLASGSELRPAAPPASEQTRVELEEILRLQAGRNAETDALIRAWDGPPTTAWTGAAVDLLALYWALLPDVRVATPVRSSRILALLHVAIYDALVATWDAKYAYGRTPPYAADARVEALVETTDVPSYPSEHAAAAAAAAAVLSHAFPGSDTTRFHELARQAGESRIAAGVAYRSDVEAGLQIGRAVAERVLQHAASDGSDAVWTGSVPEGESFWQPTPPRRVARPLDALAGRWRPWVLSRGDVFRPAPHPEPGSAAFEKDLAELRGLSTARSQQQADVARYWATEAPSVRWVLFLEDEIRERRLNPLRAARAHALVSVAAYDAFIACWDAKYHYWLARPITVDPTITTVFSTPPFPSYPSGHSTQSAAVAEVLAELFPDRAELFHEKALEASLSRVYGGVHYRFDIVAGEELGREVGREVVTRARHDGSGI